MTGLFEAQCYLDDFESSISEIQKRLNQRQSDRIFSSHVWMSQKIDDLILGKLKPIKEKITYAQQSTDSNLIHLKVALNLTTELYGLLNEINSLYKQREGYSAIKRRWDYNFPAIFDRVNKLRDKLKVSKEILEGPSKPYFKM